jgi:hypothetical protein
MQIQLSACFICISANLNGREFIILNYNGKLNGKNQILYLKTISSGARKNNFLSF